MKNILWSIILPLALMQAVKAQGIQITGRVVDVAGVGIPQVAARLTIRCENPMFPNGITFTSDAVTNDSGNYTIAVPILGGSSCNNRTQGFGLEKSGYVFELAQSGSLFSPGGLHFGLRPPILTGVSAASYLPFQTSEMIISGFGENLATVTIAAPPGGVLPTELSNRRVLITDQSEAEKAAGIIYVAPAQINFVLPAGLAEGRGLIKVMNGAQVVRAGFLFIRKVVPGIFTADTTGRGLPAAIVTRVKADGTQVFEPVARFDAAQNRFVAVPVDLGTENEQVFLSLFGTGWRARSAMSAVTVKVGGTDVQVTYAGLQPTIPGLDQINVRLPRTLAGRGEVSIELRVDGEIANPVNLNIR